MDLTKKKIFQKFNFEFFINEIKLCEICVNIFIIKKRAKSDKKSFVRKTLKLIKIHTRMKELKAIVQTISFYK